MPEDDQQQAFAAGFFDKLGIIYLQLAIAALQRAQYALERLETNWLELMPDERRRLFGAASSALSNAEHSTSAIASWLGRIGKTFIIRLARLRDERKKSGDTPRAKLEWLQKRKSAIEQTLLDCDVLLEPKVYPEEIYEAAVNWFVERSSPAEFEVIDTSGVADEDDGVADEDEKLDDFDDGLETLEGEPDAR